MELPFRELGPAPGSPPPVFLPFFDPRIPRQKTGLFQDILKVGVVLKKCFRNPVANGNGLT
jgi:hypothetical protein